LAVILYLASDYSKKQNYINEFSKGVLPPLILTGIILVLIVLQPDIGTTDIIFLITFIVIISSGIRFKNILFLTMTGLILLTMNIPQRITDVRLSEVIPVCSGVGVCDDGGDLLLHASRE